MQISRPFHFRILINSVYRDWSPRMTTDITNVQNAFMMVIRVAVRAPLNLVFSFAMCLIISPRLSMMFLIAVVFLLVVIGSIMVVTLEDFPSGIPAV